MLTTVDTMPRSVSSYRRLLDRDLFDRVQMLGRDLRGLRVAHINATGKGGGVAEILATLVPLSQSVGLDVAWYVLPPDDDFFQVTKRIHNWMQGKDGHLSRRDRDVYLKYSERVARQMRDISADVWVVHDPQPVALRELAPLDGPSIWRCHIDCSVPNGGVCDFLLPWIRGYDRVLFTLPIFCINGLENDQVATQLPAIDALCPKNRHLGMERARTILTGLGLDMKRPLVAQVSRFDPWKNPWEAIDSYRVAKHEIPDLQLALVGVFSASDDPEAPEVYESVRQYAGDDPDIHLFTDPDQVGPIEINAFQAASTAILQRSTREGFGLVVTEAMWKRTPVIATPVGGIGVQIEDGKNGFLASSAGECAARIVELVRQPALARAIGEAARESVRHRFLMPRVLRDELELYSDLTRANAAAA